MTSIGDLLAALCAHLTAFDLPPAIASAHAVACPSPPLITVQLTARDPDDLASSLLVWANTLTEVTAQAWREPHGDWVHLSVTGSLPAGAAVRIYGALRLTDPAPDAGLESNATTTVPLVTLRHLATPGHATQEVTV